MLYFALKESGLSDDFLGFDVLNMPPIDWMLKALAFKNPEHEYLKPKLE